jgi:hypothetical protein
LELDPAVLGDDHESRALLERISVGKKGLDDLNGKRIWNRVFGTDVDVRNADAC